MPTLTGSCTVLTKAASVERSWSAQSLDRQALDHLVLDSSLIFRTWTAMDTVRRQQEAGDAPACPECKRGMGALRVPSNVSGGFNGPEAPRPIRNQHAQVWCL